MPRVFIGVQRKPVCDQVAERILKNRRQRGENDEQFAVNVRLSMGKQKTVAKLVRHLIWAVPARKLRKNTAKAISLIEETLPTIERQWYQAKVLGLTKYSALYNGMSFLLLMHYDFSILALNHATEVDDQKKNLYARQLCLLLHEALDDLPQVFGSSFRNSLHALPDGPRYEVEVSHTLKT